MRYGEEINHEDAHKRPEGLDPKTNGPFLDDIRRAEEDARHQARNKKSVKE